MSMKTEQCRPSGSATTKAIRDFILAGGRILITPDGELTEGGGLPRAFTHGSAAEADEYLRAGRAYLVARATRRGDARIMRAVRWLIPNPFEADSLGFPRADFSDSPSRADGGL